MNPLVSSSQMTLDFEAGLTERHASVLAVVVEGAHTHRNPLKTLAADMDMSLSELSRKLGDNPNDPRKFTLEDLELYLKASGDMNPIYYLVEKYLADDGLKQRRAITQLSKQLPNILALVKQLEGITPQ
jgi:hypothetical protein